MTKDEMLKAASTRELTKLFKARFRAIEHDDWYNMVHLSRLVKGGDEVTHSYTVDEIKAELALRPHVPNKREAKELRLKRIRQGK